MAGDLKPLGPCLIDPMYVRRVWGYHDPRPWYDRQASTESGSREPIGEVWLTGDACRIAPGAQAGKRRVAVKGIRASATLPGDTEAGAGLSYLFAAEGSARLTGSGFNSLLLPARGIAAVPALSPPFTIEDLGALDLIRISPCWPGNGL